MAEDTAFEVLAAMRESIDAEIEELVALHSQQYGEVAIEAGKILLAGGKRLRPIIAKLAFQIAGGTDMSKIRLTALSSEYIHTATLVHDDINDESLTRRGLPTMHSVTGQAKGIIGGDWLFVQGFALGGMVCNSDVVRVISDCCANIASAEFSQLDHVLDLSTSPEDYLEIVKGKTAGPFGAACEAAAYIADASDEDRIALKNFGMQLGIAYQLVDDLLDINGDERMGKPRGADVYEGKMTLPLIHALTILHGEERVRLSEVIRNFDDSLFDELISLLEMAGSIEYANILIDNHIDRARTNLDVFPESEAKSLILTVLDMVKKRNS